MARKRIAIVGGGFSGSMLAVQLVRQAHAPLDILLFEESARFAQGAAYGTCDILHLLNVPAGRMSALPDAPDHLLDWLHAHAPDWKAKIPALAHEHYNESSFIPRPLYALYLSHLLRDAQDRAEEKHIVFSLHAQRIETATHSAEGWQLQGADGEEFIADSLVLATGNPPARSFKVTSGASNERYIAHLWTEGGHRFLQDTEFSDLPHPVIILGSGLTMVDVALTLKARGLSQPIIAISRHASLPEPHMEALSWKLNTDLSAEKSLAGRVYLLRQEIARAKREGISWQGVIDALRPITAELWQSLSLPQQRRFMRHLWTRWNIHRHRMPRSSFNTLSAMRGEKLLELRKGRIECLDATHPDRLTLHWYGENGDIQQIWASYIVNCTGPEMQLSRIANPLLHALTGQEMLFPHPLGMGASVHADGSLAGKTAGSLFAIGPLLLGDRLETTAVPELRLQACELAAKLLHAA